MAFQTKSQAQLEMWDHFQRGKVSLKPKNIIPEIDFTDPSSRDPVIRTKKPHQPRKKVLDGFFMLEKGKVEFPDEATRLDISGNSLVEIVPDDLQ